MLCAKISKLDNVWEVDVFSSNKGKRTNHFLWQFKTLIEAKEFAKKFE